MRIRLTLVTTAVLLTGACNMADERESRETASRERIERKEQELERERDRKERQRSAAQRETAKLDEAEFTTPQPASSTAPAAAGISRSWFAGRWTDTGDCADAGLFSPNGTFQLASGARGMWNIRDGRLVVQGTGGRSDLQLRRIDDDTVELQGPDGAGRSTRC